MQLIHPAAIAGILLNGGFIGALYILLPRVDVSVLPADQQLMLEQTAQTLPLFFFVLLVQAVSLLLLQKKHILGVVGAAIGVFLMLPASLVYGVGCLLTYQNVRFRDFSVASPPVSSAKQVFRSNFITSSLGTAAVCGFMSWFFLSSGALDAGGIALICSIMSLILAVRVQSNPPLAFYESSMVVVPAFFSKRIELPYAALRSATLFQNKTIEFVLHDADRGLLRLNWSLNTVQRSEQKRALEIMARVLRDHNVALQ